MNKFFSEHKKALGIALCIVAFAVITLIYFSPILQGKRLNQNDIVMHKGMSKEIVDFKEETGEQSLWTNSMFGGMPAWNIGVSQDSNLMTYVNRILNFGFPHPIGAVFVSMLGFFILLLVLDCKVWVSFIGALAYGFTSYLFIVIGAGHNSKAVAMAYMAPVVAGIILTYKGKYLWGAVLTAIALALEIRAGHPQITYYLLLIAICIIIGELVETIKEKRYMHFFKASGILVGVAIIAILTCTTTLYANYEFGKETMRGAPVLKDTKNPNNQTKGLERDYITQWSYGKGETWSLMIPNAKGGATASISEDKSNASRLKKCDKQLSSEIAKQNAYWGDQPFTSGPVYVGAIVCFLFVLGLFIVKGKLKWVILAATVLSILLSWGKNFMWFTNLFLDYFPGYDKFRSVSMTLVIAEVCMPLLAFLALAELFKHPENIKENIRYFWISFGLTGGICLLFALSPQTFFGFLSSEEATVFKQLQAGQNGAIYVTFANDLEKVRASIFRADAIRSALFIIAAAAVVFLSLKKIIKLQYSLLILAALVVFDMYPINKRYLNNEKSFVEKTEKPIKLYPADEQILKDTSLDYRVINITRDPFNEATTSYFHKSVGGYHGAKLRRYQDIINYYLSNEIKRVAASFDNAKTEYDIQRVLRQQKVLGMLNTKYLIYNPKAPALYNSAAFGNAWIVSEIKWVATPNEEIDAIKDTDVQNVAIVNEEFKNVVGNFQPSPNEGTIELVEYKPNQLKYNFDSSKDELVVFSEIWTKKGWKMWIDGKESPLFRSDYILRSAIIPAGQHEIVMRYEPSIWKIGNTIQLITSLLILLGLVFVCYYTIKRRCIK